MRGQRAAVPQPARAVLKQLLLRVARLPVVRDPAAQAGGASPTRILIAFRCWESLPLWVGSDLWVFSDHQLYTKRAQVGTATSSRRYKRTRLPGSRCRDGAVLKQGIRQRIGGGRRQVPHDAPQRGAAAGVADRLCGHRTHCAAPRLSCNRTRSISVLSHVSPRIGGIYNNASHMHLLTGVSELLACDCNSILALATLHIRVRCCKRCCGKHARHRARHDAAMVPGIKAGSAHKGCDLEKIISLSRDVLQHRAKTRAEAWRAERGIECMKDMCQSSRPKFCGW